jgi:hypothetical protein
MALIFNKNERAISRPLFTDFSVVATPSSLEDGIKELAGATPTDLVVIDERFDESTKGEKQVRVMDFLQQLQGTNSSNTVVMIIVGENADPKKDENQERIQIYSEMGVDLFLKRPFGIKELQVKLKEAKTWILTPPPWIQLMRASRVMIKAGDFAKAAYGLQKLYEMKPDNLTVGLLLARALIQGDKASRAQGMDILKAIEKKHPSSVMAKKLILEASTGGFGDRGAAFETSLRLLKQELSANNVNTCLDLANKISGEKMEISLHAQIMAVLKSSDPIRTKEFRFQAMVGMLRVLQSPKDILFAIKLIHENEDQKARLREELGLLVERMEIRSEDPYADVDYVPGKLDEAIKKTAAEDPNAVSPTDEARFALFKTVLEIEPGLPSALESLVNLAVKHGKNDMAWETLDKAKQANKLSLEYYVCFAQLAIKDGKLKEASEAIHAGKRLSASDPRLESLTRTWQNLYAEKQKTG